MRIFRSSKPPKKPKLPPTVEAFLRAFNARDIEGMMDHLADEVVFRNHGDVKLIGSADSKAEFAEQIEAAFAVLSVCQQTIKSAFTMGTTTVVTIQLEVTAAVDSPNGLKAGNVLKLRGASEYQLGDDKIVRITLQS